MASYPRKLQRIAENIAPKRTIYWIIKTFREKVTFSCSEEGFKTSQSVHEVPVRQLWNCVSAVHQCRAGSISGEVGVSASAHTVR